MTAAPKPEAVKAAFRRPVSSKAAPATKDPAASARSQVISCSILGLLLSQTLSDNRCLRLQFQLRKNGTKIVLPDENEFRTLVTFGGRMRKAFHISFSCDFLLATILRRP